jgi:hypothetical protein
MAAGRFMDARGIQVPDRGGGRWRRIAVLLEPGRGGDAALDRAVALSREHEAGLAVVAQAPQAERPRCAGPSPQPFNEAVIDATARQLQAARERIGPNGSLELVCALLVEGHDPPLEAWVHQQGVDLVLLPARRPFWAHTRHPQAARLCAHAQVHVVAP